MTAGRILSHGMSVMAITGSLLACQEPLQPLGQVLLYVDTDAPLPPAPGQSPSGGPPALFDRLRIEIFAAGATEPCVGCRRDFGIDAAQIGSGEGSVGIVPPAGQGGVRVRLRLYRSGGTASGEPRPNSTIEVVTWLAETEAEGIVEQKVTLWTDHVAAAQGSLEQPLPATLGKATAGLVGSWQPATVRDCPSPPGPDEVCVPGGAFWMGDPRLYLSVAHDTDGQVEHLVVLSPYFLDASEVSVAAFRPSGLAKELTPGGPSEDPYEAGGAIANCTYTSTAGGFEQYPVNCLTWSTARKYCDWAGKSLPTEAQLEHAASARGSSAFVWGADEPGCADAVFCRSSASDDCAAFGVGPALPGSGLRDRLTLGSGVLIDLAGNVKEWAADRWNREDEPCWSSPVLFDPLCDSISPADGGARSVRGGHFDGDTLSLRAAIRTRIASEIKAVSASIGVRCARSAEVPADRTR